jgi:hypothetical protein
MSAVRRDAAERRCVAIVRGGTPVAIAWRRSAYRRSMMMENHMGKYFLAWLLGVPASLLVLIYLFTHIF